MYSRYIRRVRVIDGIAYYLVPVANLGRPPLSHAAADRCYRLTDAALRAELRRVPAAKRAATLRYGDAAFALGRYNLQTSTIHEGLFLFTSRANGSGGADGGQDPSTIQRSGMLGGGGGGTPPSPTVMDGIVPQGVATVTLQFPASNNGSRHLPRSAQPVTWSTTYSSSRSQPCSSGAAGRPPQFGAQVRQGDQDSRRSPFHP